VRIRAESILFLPADIVGLHAACGYLANAPPARSLKKSRSARRVDEMGGDSRAAAICVIVDLMNSFQSTLARHP
jgi:hypothetical protein